MGYGKIVNPEIEYLIVSFKHTGKKDKYITLWRPSNAGYCWPLEIAGTYNGYEDQYHNSGETENIPVPKSEIPVELLVDDNQGRACIKNCRASIKFIKSFIKTPVEP